jgi:hypothetical protein
VDWLRKRRDALLDNLLWLGAVALFLATGGSIAAAGSQRLVLHVWEIVLVSALLVAFGVSLGVLFLRVRRLESLDPAVESSAPEPKEHAALLSEIATFEQSLGDVLQGTASWDLASIYHELRERSVAAAPEAPGLCHLPMIRGMPGNMADVQVGDLRLYLRRMATLLEQDEFQPTGQTTHAVIGTRSGG